MNGYVLKHINEERQTLEMRIEAVKSFGCVIEYIDKKNRTNEMIYEAINQNGNAIKFIDEKGKLKDKILNKFAADNGIKEKEIFLTLGVEELLMHLGKYSVTSKECCVSTGVGKQGKHG